MAETIQGTTVEVGEPYWRENRRSSMRSRFLPLTVKGEEIEAPVGNIDVTDLPCNLDAQFVAVFEGDIIISYENEDNNTHCLRYTPFNREWNVEIASVEEAAPWTDIIAEDDIVWKSEDYEVEF